MQFMQIDCYLCAENDKKLCFVVKIRRSFVFGSEVVSVLNISGGRNHRFVDMAADLDSLIWVSILLVTDGKWFNIGVVSNTCKQQMFP